MVSIIITMNKITNQQMEVMFSFDNFNSLGRVTLMESRLETDKYPTVFEATWQQMDHIDNGYLLQQN